MIFAFLLLIVAALAIYFSCELFVNAIEWLGRKLNLGSTATGTVLAAFGTALPESAVTLFAVLSRDDHGVGKDTGMGAALGGPLVLSTVAYGLVGIALWMNRRHRKSADPIVRVENERLSRDQAAFALIFLCKAALGFVAFALKPVLGWVFLGAYGVYVWLEIRRGDTHVSEESLEPLKFHASTANPPLIYVLAQTFFSLGIIATASHFFVGQIATISEGLHIPAHLTALFLSPIATELPEVMNALIWVRCGKERLALANISGSMMIQATIPSAIGLFFTPWQFDATLGYAALTTLLAIGYLCILFRRGRVHSRTLSFAAVFYFVFLIATIVSFNRAN